MAFILFLIRNVEIIEHALFSLGNLLFQLPFAYDTWHLLYKSLDVY